MHALNYQNEEVKHMGSYFHVNACDPVLPTSRGIAYLTLRTGVDCPGDVNLLSVVNIEDLKNITEVQSFPMLSPYGMSLIDDVLFVGEGENGMRLFDASQPASLSEIKRITTLTAYDMLLHPGNSNILLIASAEGLAQYEVNADWDIDRLSFIPF